MGNIMKNIMLIDNAQAIVQSRFEKNSVHRTRPNVTASAPPNNSGMTNSPIEPVENYNSVLQNYLARLPAKN